MRKFLIAATFSALFLAPAAARAGFILEGSLGKGYQVSPTPRQWEQLNLNIAPGFSILSMFRLQLGIVMDIADGSAANTTNVELRPTLSLVPPVLPLYGRVMVVITDVLGRSNVRREYPFGAAIGARIGIPGVSIVPSMGIFAELGALPRSRQFVNADLTTSSKIAWVLEARAGAYLGF